MIRLGENIRLNAKERATLSALVGFNANPTTIASHASMLARAAASFEAPPGEADAEALAEFRLMGAVFGNLAVNP